MKRYYCNPINIGYKYQFQKVMNQDLVQVGREAADPSMICFKGAYYIFASMSLGAWKSRNMVDWEYISLPEDLPLYDYAPDVRVIGEYVYFSASSNRKNCNFYRTKDIEHGPYEEIKGTFPFWDPNLFVDEDGKIYFYWGCASDKPIFGVELNPETMIPKTTPVELIWGRPEMIGFERIGDDHTINPADEEEVEVKFQAMLEQMKQSGMTESDLSPDLIPQIKAYLRNRPYIEGAWMDRFQGKYYLQYACPGTEYNGYANAVYVGNTPLGPFTLAPSNPYSYKPGGFMNGAGHGSTMRDLEGRLWHTATMRISKNFAMERRVGIWRSGIDEEGNLFCNQRYGDWISCVDDSEEQNDIWKNPDWMLLSYQKQVKSSSYMEDREPQRTVDENAQTWWRAASAEPGEWLEVDLGRLAMVHGIQINFADEGIDVPVPGKFRGEAEQIRYIDGTQHKTRWVLEGSLDGEDYFCIEDRSDADTDLPHDLVVCENGVRARFLRITVLEVPYGQKACISGFRVFGLMNGSKPAVPSYRAERTGALDLEITIDEPCPEQHQATGYVILWGNQPDQLYHSYMIYGKRQQRIGALVSDQSYYVRVDAFNETGITEGTVSGPF